MMKIKMILLAALLALPPVGLAIEIDMSFKGTLIEMPLCTISGGETVEANFGDNISIRKIDGNYLRTELEYDLDCEHAPHELTLTLVLEGEAASFDPDALKSDRQSLGIQIYHDGKVFKPGEKITLVRGSKPKLEAVPVKDPDGKLTEGTFEAWATLSAQYQ